MSLEAELPLNRMTALLFKSTKSYRGDWRRCGAKTKRTGLPCRARALANGRCKYHGGLSTGPKTPAGRARALANLKQYNTVK